MKFQRSYNTTPSVLLTANHSSTAPGNSAPIHYGITTWIEVAKITIEDHGRPKTKSWLKKINLIAFKDKNKTLPKRSTMTRIGARYVKSYYCHHSFRRKSRAVIKVTEDCVEVSSPSQFPVGILIKFC